jgi:DNA-binding GntR family transcriptional regulator
LSITVSTGTTCDQLRQDILAGAFPSGGRLKIDELAARYATSHMPVREALRRLQGEGLIQVEPNQGARVRSVDVDFVRDIFDLRIVVEAMLARRAAERITDAQLQTVSDIQRRLESCAGQADYSGVLSANQAFHSAINTIAGNLEAIRVLERHWNIIIGLWSRHGYGAGRAAGVIADHKLIIDALARRDAESAAIFTTAHAAKAKQEMLQRVDAAVAGAVSP